MTGQTTAAAAEASATSAENALEVSSRAVIEFVIRTTFLPSTLLLSKPRDIAHGASTGDYRFLPTPFLLALITGVAVSGVTSNLNKLPLTFAEKQDTDFVKAVADFYMKINGVEAILFAVPYILGLWALACVLSFFMWRGLKESQTLFSALSWCASSIIALALLALVISLRASVEQTTISTSIFFGVVVFGLLLGLKVVRMIFTLRKERGSHIAGAISASVLAFIIVLGAGVIGSGVSYAIFQQRTFWALLARTQSENEVSPEVEATAHLTRSREYFIEKNYQGAVTELDSVLAITPESADALSRRCWVRAVWNQELDQALADCTASIGLEPRASVLDSRAFVHTRRGDLDAARADYDEALRIVPNYAHSLYGRGLIRTWQGDIAGGKADMDAGLELNGDLVAEFAGYGMTPDSAPPTPPAPAAVEAPTTP